MIWQDDLSLYNFKAVDEMKHLWHNYSMVLFFPLGLKKGILNFSQWPLLMGVKGLYCQWPASADIFSFFVSLCPKSRLLCQLKLPL